MIHLPIDAIAALKSGGIPSARMRRSWSRSTYLTTASAPSGSPHRATPRATEPEVLIEALSSLAVFALTASALVGRFIRQRLPEDHRQRETIESMQIIIGMLVTFTALVLGLLTASVKSAYDRAGHDLQEYALDLAQLDRCLRNYGSGTEAARDNLKGYTAGLIAAADPRATRRGPTRRAAPKGSRATGRLPPRLLVAPASPAAATAASAARPARPPSPASRPGAPAA
jgi:hypothetical protein